VEDQEGAASRQEEHDDEDGNEDVAPFSSLVFDLLAGVAIKCLFDGFQDFRFRESCEWSGDGLITHFSILSGWP